MTAEPSARQPTGDGGESLRLSSLQAFHEHDVVLRVVLDADPAGVDI